jgi:hypothetical protein
MKLSQALLLFLPLACAAQTIQGNLRNGTTGKAEPGQQVILFTAAGEQGRATTNDDGSFAIEGTSKAPLHSAAVLKVSHDGVEYFQPVRPGQNANMSVYDSSSRASGIKGVLSILQFQVKGKMLEVTELHAFDNASNPPTTRVDPDNLVLSIPAEAQARGVTVSEPNGGTAKLQLISIPGSNSKYRVDFPMKPGLTKYAISYEVPYTGEFVFRRQSQYPMKRIGVIVPSSMNFRSLGAKSFHEVKDQPGTHEQVIDGLDANRAFSFAISGTGELARSFRPLNPGQPSRSMGAKVLIDAPLLQGESSKANAGSSQADDTLRRNYVTLMVGMLALVGLLVWCVRSRVWAR